MTVGDDGRRDERDPVDLRATPHRIRAAAAAAGWPDAVTRRAIELSVATPTGAEWRRFLAGALAYLGVALLLAGIVTFVAYNWDRIGRFGKFALLEIALVVAVIIAWRKLPALSGQLATFAAAVIVGPLLAIYGMTYQTGADPYGLFLTWALLILPFAWVGRFGATWLLVVALLDVAIILFSSQVLGPRPTAQVLLTPLTIAAIHALGLVAWERQLRSPTPVIPEPWVSRVGALVGFGALFVTAATAAFNTRGAGLPGIVGVVSLVAAAYAVIRYYLEVRRDRLMVTLAGVAVMAWLTVLVGRVVFDVLRLREAGFILMAAFVIAQMTYGLRLFRRTRAT